MTYPNVAFLGKAGSGKDTAAAFLTRELAYVPVAFADPLRAVALALDPMVGADAGHFGYLPTRLSQVVDRYGWDGAKRTIPEVRRTLQRLGQAVRDVDPAFWLSLALERLDTAETWSLPVVVTDCRYRNEAEALRARGFTLVRIVRPSAGPGSTHVSETELDTFPVDITLSNTGTVVDLWEQVRELTRTPE